MSDLITSIRKVLDQKPAAASVVWQQEVPPLLEQISSTATISDDHWPVMAELLLYGINLPGTYVEKLHRPITKLLYHGPVFQRIVAGLERDLGGETLWFLTDPHCLILLEQPLLRRYLLTALVCHDLSEHFLTCVRRGLLMAFDRDDIQPAIWDRLLPLLNALGVQGVLNEYAWNQREDETAILDQLLVDVADDDLDLALRLLLLGAYRPLWQHPQATTLLRDQLNELREDGVEEAFIQLQLVQPAALADHMGRLESLMPIADAVSQAVQAQYEANPYPRWAALQAVPQFNWAQYLASQLGYQPTLPPGRGDNILIAGCGTGKHPLHLVLCLQDSRITALDLSRASLAYASLKAEQYQLSDRVRFVHGDILDLPKAGASYDVIESVGVIHHMADPAAGLAALVACLKPGGWLRLGLYSRTARWAVNEVRAANADQETINDADTLRRLRQDMLVDPGPVSKRLRQLRDFYSLSEFRDLLFHVQEHQFDIPDIESLLARHGLVFAGMSFATGQEHQHFAARFADDPQQRSLANWQRFEAENPDTFAGMYNFWCHLPG